MAGHHHHGGSVHLWQKRLIISAVASIPAVYFMLVDFMGNQIPLAQLLMPWSAFITLIIATIVMLYLGASFFHSTMAGLRNHMFNMDSLITIGTSTAYVYSLISYGLYVMQNRSILITDAADAPRLYFSTAVFLFTFVVLGKWLETRATSKTEQSIKQLIKLRPQTAHLVNGNNIANIPVEQVRPGDRLLIKPGETIPTDGYIASGNSSVNESMITGESVDVDKHEGSRVIGGTLNGHGSLEMIAERVGNDTMLARIIKLISDAQATRAPIESLADRIANVFVPLVIVIALATFAIWYFYIGTDISSAMIMFVAVVMIACPCAFGLATPTAVTVGIGLGSRHGILIKGGNVLQQLSRIDTVVFDKTGTLTSGQPVVTDTIAIDGDAKHALTIASSLERRSEHSLAQAIISKADNQHLETLPVKRFNAVAGLGITGFIGNIKYYLGNEELAHRHFKGELPDVSKLVKASKTICYLFTARKMIAVIGIADQPKPTAARTIKQLHRLGIGTYLLSGDNEATARAVARRLGIKQVIANVMPDDKASEIIQLRRQGHFVAMVGDGINDAPAIASANVGVAIGTGTDAAIETGNVVLVSGDPLSLCGAIRLARATVNKIYQNLFFSLFYNVVSIPLAAGAFSLWGIGLRPELAGLIMAMSSVAVIINSLTLKLADLGKSHEPIRILAPVVLFLLFTAIYIEFIAGSSI